MLFYITIGIIIVIVIFFMIRRGSSGGASDKIVVDPTIGFLNYEPALSQIQSQDSSILGLLFSRMVIAQDNDIPQCDVLFLYGNLQPDGSMRGAGCGYSHYSRYSLGC